MSLSVSAILTSRGIGTSDSLSGVLYFPYQSVIIANERVSRNTPSNRLVGWMQVAGHRHTSGCRTGVPLPSQPCALVYPVAEVNRAVLVKLRSEDSLS